MTGYQKTVAYLDYLENGMKIRNGGFVRAEGNNGQMCLEMKVKNIPENFSGEYEVKTDTGGTIGRIRLNRGSGSFRVVWKTDAAAPEGKKTIQANGLYVRLPARHLLQTVWPSQMEFWVDEEEDALPAEPDRRMAENTSPTEPDRKAAETAAESVLPDIVPEMPAPEGEAEAFDDVKLPSDGAAAEAMEERAAKAEEKAGRKEREEEPVCYGDKWEQLSHMYAQIHPFADEREYLSIAPKDFVILRQEYQKMVHNSFLLHGYYNYRHLILGKIKEKEEWRYYLGVPGNFYNREKMVAEMFGFEAFEGERNPAKAGDFGYFMKRVEI